MKRLVLLVLCFAALPASARAQSEAVEYYGLDAIGSVRVVFDQNGTVVSRIDYAPFGRELTSSGNAPDRKFAALFRDSEAGLDYAQARSYQVRTGRFSAPDPIYAGLFEPQLWNRYAYALNNPEIYVDPDGLMTALCRIGPQEDYKPSYACVAFLLSGSIPTSLFQTAGRGNPQGRTPNPSPDGSSGGDNTPSPNTSPPNVPPVTPPTNPPPPAPTDDKNRWSELLVRKLFVLSWRREYAVA